MKYYAYVSGMNCKSAEGTKQEVSETVANWVKSGEKPKYIKIFEGDGDKVWIPHNFEIGVRID